MIHLEPTGEIMVSVSRMENPCDELNPIEWISSCTWQGGDIIEIGPLTLHYAGLKRRDIDIGDVFDVGPFRLRCIDLKWGGQHIIAVRHAGLRSDLLYHAYRLRSRLEPSKQRLILTAAVWGLATFKRDRCGHWADIHLVDRLQRWWRS